MRNYLLVILIICSISCKKESTENPYEEIEVTNNTNPDFATIEPSNFAYLHEKVFKPTCANSGCHDGTFEPRFQSISSSYNSLVNHPVISNDEANSFVKRVFPGSYQESLLNARLTSFLPNTSGIMPLEVDGESDWNTNSQEYITLIQNWITNGAPDMYGNLPGNGSVDLPPSINGLVVFPNGNTSTPYERDPDQVGITPILVDSELIDIWIQVQDDSVNPTDFTLVDLSFAPSISELSFDNSIAYENSNQINALDFSDNLAPFYHRITLDLSAFESGDNIYLRNFLNDGNQTVNTVIPNNGSSNVITAIFVLQII